MATVTLNHATHAPTLARLGGLLVAPVLAFATWVQRIRQRRELLGLLSQPDYVLKDVGLQRDEIAREGLKRFWMD